jgi:hypothetical protein
LLADRCTQMKLALETGPGKRRGGRQYVNAARILVRECGEWSHGAFFQKLDLAIDHAATPDDPKTWSAFGTVHLRLPFLRTGRNKGSS